MLGLGREGGRGSWQVVEDVEARCKVGELGLMDVVAGADEICVGGRRFDGRGVK